MRISMVCWGKLPSESGWFALECKGSSLKSVCRLFGDACVSRNSHCRLMKNSVLGRICLTVEFRICQEKQSQVRKLS